MDIVFCQLGSKGNASLIRVGQTIIQIDMGVSLKTVKKGLEQLHASLEDIQAVFITHEHSDHIGGLGVFLRKYNVPVYATEGTIEAIKASGDTKKVDMSLFHPIRNDERFTIRDIEINAMSISHDAADPVAYRFKNEGVKTAVAESQEPESKDLVEQAIKTYAKAYYAEPKEAEMFAESFKYQLDNLRKTYPEPEEVS